MPDANGFYDPVTERRPQDWTAKTWDWTTNKYPQHYTVLGPKFETHYNNVNRAFYNHWYYGQSQVVRIKGTPFDVRANFADTRRQFRRIQGQLYHYLSENLYQRLVIENGDPGPRPSKGSPDWETATDLQVEMWSLQRKHDDAFAARQRIIIEDGIDIEP